MNSRILCHRLAVPYAILCASLISMGSIYEKTGFYAGLSVGSGYNAGTFDGKGSGLGLTFRTSSKTSTCCWEKGFCGFVGYMTHLSYEDWLGGIEFGIERPFFEKHFDVTFIDLTDMSFTCQSRMKVLGVAKLHARIGKVLDGKWFVYGLVGVAVKKTEFCLQEQDVGEVNMKKSLWGVAVGAGIEREISENWRLGLELVNTYYPSKTFEGKTVEGQFTASPKFKANSTQISLRLAYNF